MLCDPLGVLGPSVQVLHHGRERHRDEGLSLHVVEREGIEIDLAAGDFRIALQPLGKAVDRGVKVARADTCDVCHGIRDMREFEVDEGRNLAFVAFGALARTTIIHMIIVSVGAWHGRAWACVNRGSGTLALHTKKRRLGETLARERKAC